MHRDSNPVRGAERVNGAAVRRGARKGGTAARSGSGCAASAESLIDHHMYFDDSSDGVVFFWAPCREIRTRRVWSRENASSIFQRSAQGGLQGLLSVRPSRSGGRHPSSPTPATLRFNLPLQKVWTLDGNFAPGRDKHPSDLDVSAGPKVAHTDPKRKIRPKSPVFAKSAPLSPRTRGRLGPAIARSPTFDLDGPPCPA